MAADADSTPLLILITGVMASGKSTVAQAIADRLERSVHLRGDVFRKMIVNGREEMTPRPTEAARAQLLLRYRLAADAAASYLAAGFSVVYQDVILGDDLRRVASCLPHSPLHIVVLCPTAEAVASRAGERRKPGYGTFAVAELDTVLRTQTPRLGLWLDSSDMSAEQTADAILQRLDDALVTKSRNI